jgi:hypothetical protein
MLRRLQWLCQRSRLAHDQNWARTLACESAARAGALGILQELRRRGYEWNDDVLKEAAGEGHLDVFVVRAISLT